MKGYNVRMALIAGAGKKHSGALYEKGYGTISTRVYRLQSLSNERLVDFLNMEQGGPQARDFANEMNVSSPFYKIEHKNMAPCKYDGLYSKEVEKSLSEYKFSEETPEETLKDMLKQCTEALYPPPLCRQSL